MEVLGPSGLTLALHKPKGRVLSRLADLIDRSYSDGITTTVGSSFDAVVTAGPYSFVEVGSVAPEWNRVLKGDVLRMLMAISAETLGDDFAFVLRCDQCGKPAEGEVKLSELPLKALSKESAARVRRGDTFEATVAGHTFGFHLATFAQDVPIDKFRKQEGHKKRTELHGLAAQITKIDGKPETNIRKRYNFIADQLDVGEVYELRRQIDEVDCGVNTQVRGICIECGWVQEDDLPFKGLLNPRKRKGAPTGEDDEAETSSESPS